MPRKFVDLSIYLENEVLSDPPAFAPKIQYFRHDSTFEQIAPFFPGLKKEDLPDGEGWAAELVQLSTHNGTHLDAPYHFHSTMWPGPRWWASRIAPATLMPLEPPRHKPSCRSNSNSTGSASPSSIW